jgi:hypothetical protein
VVTAEKAITIEELANRFLDLSGFYESEDDKLYAMPLNPNLRVDELDEAIFWRDITRGFVGIFGDPGSGKTLLLTAAQLKMNYYFMREMLSDYWPKQPFVDQVQKVARSYWEPRGELLYQNWLQSASPEDVAKLKSKDKSALINSLTAQKIEGSYGYIDEEKLLDELQSVDKLAKDKAFNLSEKEKAEWVAGGKGGTGIRLHGRTLALSEMDRWLNCRRTASEINNLITNMVKQFRHLDLGLWGDCVDIMDLDRQRAVPRFSTIIQATPLGNGYFEYHFRTSRKLTSKGTVFEASKRKYTLYGPDWYKFYSTRNPVALSPKLKKRDEKGAE